MLLLILTSMAAIRGNRLNSKAVEGLLKCGKELGSARERNKSAINAFNNIVQEQWELEGKKIKKGLILRDTNNHKISFDSLLSNKDKLLVLRFFETTCEDCQLQEMKLMEELKIREDIIVIASFDSFRDFSLYMKAYDINLRVYHFGESEIMLKDVDKKVNQVFSFITDNTYQINNVHIGSASLPEISKTYYQIVEESFNVD